MEEDALQLRDVVPAEPLLPHPGLPWWAWTGFGLAAAILIGLALILWRVHRRNEITATFSIDRDAVYQEAVATIEACAGLPAREASVRVSGALRFYLAKVCDDPSLFETHEEFLARHKALEHFPETTREQVSALLTRLAAMKYDRPEGSAVDENFTRDPLSVLRQVHQQSAA